MPAGTLDAPTPKFLILVGNSSAVYTGITTLDEEMANLPSMAHAIVIQLPEEFKKTDALRYSGPSFV